jgi:hypothetical protein
VISSCTVGCCCQVKRAKKFLDILFEQAQEPVVVVVTHSGFTRSILLAVAREPYRPQNAELVPVLVDKTSGCLVGGGGLTGIAELPPPSHITLVVAYFLCWALGRGQAHDPHRHPQRRRSGMASHCWHECMRVTGKLLFWQQHGAEGAQEGEGHCLIRHCFCHHTTSRCGRHSAVLPQQAMAPPERCCPTLAAEVMT